MNGMILQSAPETKDIKFSGKKGADTESKESGELFEKLIHSLVEEGEESSGSDFLLGKLLNISSELEAKGKKIADFSKGELLEQLKTKDIKEDSADELVVLEELFEVALVLKNGGDIEALPIKSESLKVALGDKNILAQLKGAKNIKELLEVADKNGVKVKNFQFFQEEAVLDPKDKKLVQKVTSQEIFKMIEPKVVKAETKKVTEQNILTKLINKEQITKQEPTKVATATPILEKEIQKAIKGESMAKVASSVAPILSTKKEPIATKLDPAEMVSDLEEEKPLPQTAKIDESFKHPKHIKAPQNTLSDLLKNTQTTTDNSKIKETPVLEEDSEPLKEVSSEKSTTSTEVKTETTTKIKETQDVKKSLNTFATEFKEKVESYKSPLMKIKMQLSPQNLGDVDVTLVNRGSTLQVNITSNNNSMAIFMQNQAEFKNSLVNMGFSDLQMNFSENGSKNQQQNKKDEKNDNSYENINNEEENDSVEIILPNYV